jgi:hypothetical protein
LQHRSHFQRVDSFPLRGACAAGREEAMVSRGWRWQFSCTVVVPCTCCSFLMVSRCGDDNLCCTMHVPHTSSSLMVSRGWRWQFSCTMDVPYTSYSLRVSRGWRWQFSCTMDVPHTSYTFLMVSRGWRWQFSCTMFVPNHSSSFLTGVVDACSITLRSLLRQNPSRSRTIG